MSRHQPRDFRWMRKPADVKVKGQVLPAGFADQLRALYVPRTPNAELDAALSLAIEDGWTASALGNALGLTRERVLQRAHLGTGRGPRNLSIPPPPRHQPMLKHEEPKLPPEIVGRLRELHAVAKTVNGGTPSNDPRRLASVELAALMAECCQRGFGTQRLGKLLGISKTAVQFHLGRHGHRSLPPSMARQRYKGRATGERVA